MALEEIRIVFKQLRLRKFRFRVAKQRYGGVALVGKVGLRVFQIVTALARSLGECRIGKVVDVGDAGLSFLGGDLHFQFICHAVEFGDHQVELRDLSALLVHLELLQPNKVLT